MSADLKEVYAACVLEYVRRADSQKMSGPFHFIGKDARDAFNLPYSENLFKGAIKILEEIGALVEYRRPGMTTYYKVDSKLFESAMSDPSGFGVRSYALTRGTHDGQQYDFLEAYADLGSAYLHDALEAFESDIIDAGDGFGEEANDGVVHSAAWTGLTHPLTLDDTRKAVLVSALDRAEANLASLGESQETRSLARAYIIAARALAEAPDPPIDLIWKLLTHAAAIATIAQLFVPLIQAIAS